MSEYHVISLIFSGATAFGTVSATLAALYLGLRSDKIKLKIKANRVNGHENIPTANGSHFAITVTNVGGPPQTIYYVGLRLFVKKKVTLWGTTCDCHLWWKVPDETLILIGRIEKKLECSETCRAQQSIDELKKSGLAGDLRIAVGVSTARKGEIYSKFDKKLLL